jgi:hypothetical protein
VQGIVVVALLELGALHLSPTPLGAHVALPLFAAAYAWEERAVFWRYATPVLLGWAVLVPAALGGGLSLVPHALAALLGWILVRFLPGARSADAERSLGPVEQTPSSTLGLRDRT